MSYIVTQIAPLTFRVRPDRDYTNRRPLSLDRAAAKLKRRGVTVDRLGISGHAEMRLPSRTRTGEDCTVITAEELADFINHQ